jgi:hypothetical protein
VKKYLLLGAALLNLAGMAHAGPDEYIYPARVTAGEREIDFKFGSRNMNDKDQNRSSGSIGLGYGVNEHWFTEVYFKYNHNAGSKTEFDAIEWENRIQLTETGKYPVDFGFLFEIERPQDRSEGYEVKWGPLLQTDIGNTEWIANALIQRNYRADAPSSASAFYRLQGRYLYRKEFSFGFQAFGDLGTWDNWATSQQQGHRIGPAAFGKIGIGEKQAIKYNVAYLVGKTRIDDEAFRGKTLRMQIEYEY